jgi:beta-exotoxin I transport system ATP-binding protein
VDAIVLDRLTKSYGRERGVVDLSFTVGEGEVFGYLGPNGAGKTTTIRTLLDLIRPTSGSVRALGFDAQREGVELRRRLGYLPGELSLYEKLTARELLSYVGRLRGRVDAEHVRSLAHRFELPLDRPIRDLSRGNKQKVGLVQAFAHRPELLVLDEPTSGLDPLMQQTFNELLRETAAEGRTVFLSSHVLSEVQHVADRVGIIRSGRLTDVDSVGGLRERSLRHVTITFATPVDASPFAALDGVRIVRADGAILRLTAPEPAMDELVKVAAAYPIVDLVSQPADLEEIFLELYREPDGSD